MKFLLIFLLPVALAVTCSDYTKKNTCQKNGCEWVRQTRSCQDLIPSDPGTTCTNTCRYAYDGECDDGGLNSDYDLCPWGSDCADCGPRTEGETFSPTTLAPTLQPVTGTPTAPTVPTPAPLSEFTIELSYTTETSSEITQIFTDAVNKWQEVIIGDVGNNLAVVAPGDCVCSCSSYPETRVPLGKTWDDVLIFVTVAPIDGSGGILGRAGPCRIDSDWTVRAGIMQFDIADVQDLISEGTFEDVIRHEMAHVLGIGTMWEFGRGRNKRRWLSGNPLTYNQPGGLEGHELIGGTGYPIVEEDGGPGTARGHWDEQTYNNELLTGYLNFGENPLSSLTVHSLKDLGYVIDPTKAELFTIPTGRRLRSKKTKTTKKRSYGHDILDTKVSFVKTIKKQ